MLVGLISDTHLPEAGADLWPQVYEAFLGLKPAGPKVDLILHAGDLHVTRVLDLLEERVGVPVIACRGNGDDGSGGRPVIPEGDPRLQANQIMEIDGFRIGMTHTFPVPEYAYRTIEKAMQQYFGGPVHIVVHGDTHTPDIKAYKGVLCINSGSPMLPRNMTRSLGTVAFLRIERGRASAWIHQLE